MKPTLDPNFVLAAANYCWEGLIRPALRGRLDEEELATGRRSAPGEMFVIFGLACVVGPSLGLAVDPVAVAEGLAVVVIVERRFGPINLLGQEMGLAVCQLLEEYPREGLPVLYVHRDGNIGLACIEVVFDTGREGAAINAPATGGQPS